MSITRIYADATDQLLLGDALRVIGDHWAVRKYVGRAFGHESGLTVDMADGILRDADGRLVTDKAVYVGTTPFARLVLEIFRIVLGASGTDTSHDVDRAFRELDKLRSTENTAARGSDAIYLAAYDCNERSPEMAGDLVIRIAGLPTGYGNLYGDARREAQQARYDAAVSRLNELDAAQ